MSITLSLIAVFIPLFLMSGYVGLLFREFAVTVSVSLVLSLLISLTLTPMMCSRLLKPERKEHGRLYRMFERGFDGLLHAYEAGLKVVLRHRFITLMVMFGTVALTGYLYVVIPKGFFPQQDTGLIIGLSEAAQDISYQAMAERQQALLDAIMRDPAVASIGVAVGAGGGTTTVNNGRVFIALKPENQRAPVDQVIARLRTNLAKIQGITLYMQAAQDITIGGRLSKTQYPVHLGRCRPWRAQSLGRAVSRQDQSDPGHRRCHDRSAQCRADARHHDQAGCRRRAMASCPYTIDNTLDDAFGQRIVSTMYTDPQSIPCGYGGRAAVPIRPRRAQRHLCPVLERTAGAVVHPGRQRRDRVAARGQPSRPVPVGDDLVQPHARHRDRSGRQRHPAG